MATGGFDGSVRLWEPAAPIFSPAACLAYPGEARSLAFAPDSRSLRAAGTAGVARWDVRAGSAFPHATEGGNDGNRCGPGRQAARHGRAGRKSRDGPRQPVAFSPDGRILASTHEGGDVVLWDARGGRQLGLLKGHRDRVIKSSSRPTAARSPRPARTGPSSSGAWPRAGRRRGRP